MDAQVQTLVLQLLLQTADGLTSALEAPIGKMETGEESATRFQVRMDLSIERLRCIIDIVQRGVASPEQLRRLWDDREDEWDYQQRQPKTTGEWEIS